jgi:toxin FitB
MRFLLDTMIVSEMTKSRIHPGILAWYGNADLEQLYLSSVSFAELERGAAALDGKEREKAKRLRAWIDSLAEDFSGRILSVDVPAARLWGRLSHAVRRQDEDVMIGAIALHHKCVVVTRNVRHFRDIGVETLNPYGT